MPLSPLLLAPDNVTPASRTPWGGRKLIERFNKCPAGGSAIVGESWEVSVEPSFPSRASDTGKVLPEVVAGDPRGWLGAAAAARFDSPHILTKLLDAADDLSLQVHPRVYLDDRADEGGKFETWLILDHEPGAGIYLGFVPGTTAADIIQHIQRGANLSRLMNFVAVERGDVFHIQPGTPHAVGRGITLFEPQSVRPRARSLTYRCWDWNRRYDPQGRRSATGEPREIHLQKFIEVTSWHRVTARSLVHMCRERPERSTLGGLQIESVEEAGWYRIDRIRGSGALNKLTEDHFVCLTCLSGAVALEAAERSVLLSTGRSAVIPAAVGHFELSLDDADVLVVWDTPENGRSYR